jgi:GntR family transcriptional regulator, transcriptional repressor for pyruvate dehydrogenase complex
MEPAYRRIMSELLDDIVSGRLAPGERLPSLGDIAVRHACGRGAAREAIRALEERGVVEAQPGRGQQVLLDDHWAALDREVAEATLLRHRDTRLLRQAIEALRLVETQTAMLAARRVEEGDLKLLSETLDLMRESIGDSNGARALAARFLAAEQDFHRSLTLMARNPFLADALKSLHGVIASVRQAEATERDPAVVRAHEAMLAALRARDPTAAAAAVDGYARQLASWLRV